MDRNWALLVHPLSETQLDRLGASVLQAKSVDPQNWRGNASSRLYFQIQDVVLERVPSNPFGTEFRQGNTLGKSNRHWFRAKFGGSRFRVLFRADSAARIIVYGWVNDRDTLRKAGSTSDPYTVFAGMLASGDPPND